MSAPCVTCGEVLEEGARFCEACGKPVAGAVAPAGEESPLDDAAPISAPTSLEGPVAVAAASRPPCTECGGVVDADLYCQTCGAKAPSERDHFREAPASWVAGVCDRGIVHHRNEDAMALAADGETSEGGRAVLVVCDGVSSSMDSDVASLAAARAALASLRGPTPQGMGTPESQQAAVARMFALAVEVAQSAVINSTREGSPSPASCTFVAAVVEAGVVRFASLGDSRAYWLPDLGEGVLLTRDDSVAQQYIEAGIPRQQAENMPRAHAITKWLGRDAEHLSPGTGERVLDRPGWVLVCSDGLWNYASEPAAILREMAASGETTPAGLALALVEFAKGRGGRDNISVALARVGEPAAGPVAAPSTTTTSAEPTLVVDSQEVAARAAAVDAELGIDPDAEGTPDEGTPADPTDVGADSATMLEQQRKGG